MAVHAQNEVIDKVFDTLNGDSTLTTTLGAGIFDFVPEGTDYPYVRVGEMSLGDFGGHDFDGFEGAVSVHVWSQATGSKECRLIQNRIYTLLHELDLALSNSTITMRCTLTEVLRDPDAKTYHGVQQFRLMLGGQ